MSEFVIFECDGCGERFGERNWVVTYPVVRAAKTEYHNPRREELHACLDCYRDHYEIEDEAPKGFKRWCWDRETGGGRQITGLLESDGASEQFSEFVPRDEFGDGTEKIATFVETIL